MKKVFLSLAIAAVFSLGFISCAQKTDADAEAEAADTEMVDEAAQDVEPVAEPAAEPVAEPEAEAEVVE